MAALADVVRFRLLAKYGGIWLDASIFVMYDSFLESDFFWLRKCEEFAFDEFAVL